MWSNMLRPPRLSRRRALGIIAAAALPIRGASKPTFPGMPGRFPRRVVAIEHSKAVVNKEFQPLPIAAMMREGMLQLTGEHDLKKAYQALFQTGDVVGIKVNPNGREGLISSAPVLEGLLYGLDLAGVRMSDVIVYERYQEILARVTPWLPRWIKRESASPEWTRVQQDMTNYDPKWFVDLPIVLADQKLDNPVARRSHLAEFVTQKVTKIINLAVLKHHGAGGVTLALKNITYGCANNVNRSHDPGPEVRVQELIPAIADLTPIRSKVVLNVVDGLNALYHGGPYGRVKFMWPHNRVYFSTDPVAIDRIGWKIIDEKRASVGMRPVDGKVVDEFTSLYGHPEHITLAGQKYGLGEWRDAKIDFKVTKIA